MTDDDGYARIAAQFSLLQGEVISERARAEKAEAALRALEAQVHAEETPHRTRMRVAEARVKVLEAALRAIYDEITDDSHEDSEDPDEMLDSLMKIQDIAAKAMKGLAS